MSNIAIRPLVEKTTGKAPASARKAKAFRVLRLVALGVCLAFSAFVGGYATHEYDAFAFDFAQAQECLAQVSSVEGNVLDETGQRYIDSVVLNRARYIDNGRSWLENVCPAAYATHYNKKIKRHFVDFSGLDGRTPFDDYSGRYGWDDSKRYAFWMLVTELTPFKAQDRLAEEYQYYFSEGVDLDWFQKANNTVCDVTIPYFASAKAQNFSLMYFCRLERRADA